MNSASKAGKSSHVAVTLAHTDFVLYEHRRTGLVLKETAIDAQGMPDVDALFESTMELEDEGERTQKSPTPVVKH